MSQLPLSVVMVVVGLRSYTHPKSKWHFVHLYLILFFNTSEVEYCNYPKQGTLFVLDSFSICLWNMEGVYTGTWVSRTQARFVFKTRQEKKQRIIKIRWKSKCFKSGGVIGSRWWMLTYWTCLGNWKDSVNCKTSITDTVTTVL